MMTGDKLFSYLNNFSRLKHYNKCMATSKKNLYADNGHEKVKLSMQLLLRLSFHENISC